jgi:succinate dehydrogenase / fumarate reductase cytochrome b subunit
MATLVTTISETLRYRGRIGQWSWVLHRLAGLGTLLFLVIHVIDTSWVYFFPDLYENAIRIYQTPLFTLGEFGLAACVVYHAFNGLRITLFDFRPDLWEHQALAGQLVYLATAVVLVPTFVMMGVHALEFYSGRPFDLGLDAVVRDVVIPFGGGMVVALFAGVVLSVGFGAVTGLQGLAGPALQQRSRFDQFMWAFMRVSGVALLPLVLGHFAIMHVIEGVFSINAMQTATAAAFVAQRWAFVGWRLYDAALLALALIHGFNGFRYVVRDYAHNPALRRGILFVALVGCVGLIIVGALALIGGVPGM